MRIRRRIPCLVGALLTALALAGCGVLQPTPARRITTTAVDVSPFQPSNSAAYSSATLRAERTFVRWDQERGSLDLVTWPTSCAHVPVAISFVPGGSVVQVRSGPAPRAAGPRQCSPGHVLTSMFAGSRALRRDRRTTFVVDGRRVVLPEAPALEVQRISADVSDLGTPHPLRQVDIPLPQYSVPESVWHLAEATTPGSTSIRLAWEGGTCQRNASRAYVAETRTTVTIDLALEPPALAPVPPHAGHDWCAGVGTGLTATVRLQRPLGTRTLQSHAFAPRAPGENAY